MLAFILVISHTAAVVLGTLEGPKIVAFFAGILAKFKASRALSDAQKVVAAAEADAAKLEAAKKLVAAHPKVTAATGPTGPTGA